MATQSQTVCVFKANMDKASFRDFVKALEAERENDPKNKLERRGCEAQPGKISECPWMVTHTELFGSSVFVAFSNFLALRLCAFLFPGGSTAQAWLGEVPAESRGLRITEVVFF